MKSILISIFSSVLIVVGMFYFLGSEPSIDPVRNVTVQDGKQTVEIFAKGGYSPKKSVAKANIPTTLSLRTRGTFDCSSALRIPTLGFDQHLPASGETVVELPPQKAGSTLEGLCAMGMYHFSVEFQ